MNLFVSTTFEKLASNDHMTARTITATLLFHELDFTASRSSGPGGQHVNKVNSKITVKFDVARSKILSDEEKSIMLKRLTTQLTKDGVLIISSQDKRSQLENKEDVIRKLERMIASAFEEKKPRKKTKPSKTSIQKRIKSKKNQAEKKQWRQKPEL